MKNEEAVKRLEYLRGEIVAERISYSELVELQELSEHIDPDDSFLREWAGLPEYSEDVQVKAGKMNDTMTVKQIIGFVGDLLYDSDADTIMQIVEDISGIRLEYLGGDLFKVEGE